MPDFAKYAIFGIKLLKYSIILGVEKGKMYCVFLFLSCVLNYKNELQSGSPVFLFRKEEVTLPGNITRKKYTGFHIFWQFYTFGIYYAFGNI